MNQIEIRESETGNPLTWKRIYTNPDLWRAVWVQNTATKVRKPTFLLQEILGLQDRAGAGSTRQSRLWRYTISIRRSESENLLSGNELARPHSEFKKRHDRGVKVPRAHSACEWQLLTSRLLGIVTSRCQREIALKLWRQWEIFGANCTRCLCKKQ